MTPAPTLLNGRDWDDAEQALRSSSPFNYVVLDDLLDETAARALRRGLIEHWGWRQKSPISPHLHNDRPELPAVFDLADALRDVVPGLIGHLDLVFWWAIMYHRNVGGTAHSDHGEVTLNLWLTPDEHNLDAGTGGLVLLDVKRTPEMKIHEFSAPPLCSDYAARHTNGGQAVIPYRWNRAVLFDSTTFHHPQPMHFDPRSAWTYRLGLTLTFDHPAVVDGRLAPYYAADPEAAFREAAS